MTASMQTLVEWLHEHPSRMIVIRAAKQRDARVVFELITRLPDGRKVRSSVEIIDELMGNSMAGKMIVHNAKLAVESLLSQESS